MLLASSVMPPPEACVAARGYGADGAQEFGAGVNRDVPASPVPELAAETQAPLSMVILAAPTLISPPVPLASLSVKKASAGAGEGDRPVAFTVTVPPLARAPCSG